MMDFISKSIMNGRSKLSRIIHVKPYNPDSSGEDADEEVEEDRVDMTDNNDDTPSEQGYPPTPEPTDNEDSDDPTDGTKSRPSRSRSLERIPISQSVAVKMTINTHSDITRTHSLGSPDLAPVNTNNNVLNMKHVSSYNKSIFEHNNKDFTANDIDINDSMNINID
ncbi:hypothetical protein Pcinc_017264 [Petrolisthes cinctipes]|uniref:Uncharacterized protein n=1 Tax=Petrolisthes cinctipes TaxID=88211 RepID=A0AAE1FQL0_PETCI|nr:hypothetical protein Pcinc_017264 [Petrolisthes cinctipes]